MIYRKVYDLRPNDVFVLRADLERSLDLHLQAFLQRLALGSLSLLQIIAELSQMIGSSLQADDFGKGLFDPQEIKLPVYYRGIKVKKGVPSAQITLLSLLPDEQRRFEEQKNFDWQAEAVVLGQLQG